MFARGAFSFHPPLLLSPSPFTAGSYDAPGNLLYDGVHTYTYDAEDRIVSVDSGTGANYVYDANGRREVRWYV